MSYVSHLLSGGPCSTDDLINRWHHSTALRLRRPATTFKAGYEPENIERELAARAIDGDTAALEWIEGIVAIMPIGQEVSDELTNF